MTPDRFRQLHAALSGHCTQLLLSKNEEYSRDGDRLHNFKRAGEKLGISPEEALLGMKVKHDVSIDDIVKDLAQDKLPTLGLLMEKIADEINYQYLLFGLIMERMDNRESEDEL